MPEIVKNSVSQMQNAKGCMRRWWGRSVQHWPQPKTAATIYGDVLHAVCDRYINATDQGLDIATGRLVDLYPTDWYKMKKRWDKTNTIYEINIVEQAQIKLLIQTAIEKGILLREPGRKAEQEFHTNIIVPGFENYSVDVNGFKDLVLPDGVRDHKTSKGTKYCLTINKIKEDIQMMFYGLDHLLRYPNLTEVSLGHNQFIKDRKNPKVQQRIAKVTPDYLVDFFNQTILPLMYDMLLYRLKYPKGTGNYFKDIPGARDTKECNFYYGKRCPYINICTGVCTPTEYCDIFKVKENRSSQPKLGVQPMTSKLMAAIAAEQGGVVPPSPAPVQAPGVAPGPVPAPAPIPAPAPAPAPAPILGPAPQVALTSTTTASGQVIPAFTAPTPVQAPAPILLPQTTQTQQPTAVAVPAPIPAPAMPQAQMPVAASTEALTALNQTPWYSLDCELCKVSGLQGFRADGQPCQICQIKSGNAAQPAAANTDGSVTYAQPGQEFQSPPLPAAVVQAQEQTAATPIAAAPGTQQIQPGIPGMPQHPGIANPPQSAQNPPQSAQNPPQSAQNPPQSALPDTGVHYTLLMGCTMSVDHSNDLSFDAQDMYRQALDLAKQESGQDLRSLDHFKALEIIDTMVPSAVSGMSTAVISAHTGTKGSLYHRFVEGLRMLADRVIVACAE